MIRGYRVWDNQEKTYSDKAFSIDQLGICYVQDEDGYWEEIDDSRFIVEFETGLTDKNGKEIREGDIVEWVDGLWEKHIFEIMWNECRASFQMVEIGQEYPYILQGLSDKMKPYCEVIGNIHEPPKDFRPEHLKRMGVSISKGGEE